MITLIPAPKRVEKDGEKALRLSPRVYTQVGEWSALLTAFLDLAKKAYEIDWQIVPGGVELALCEGLPQGGYRIDTRQSVQIQAGDAEGIRYGLVSLLQLIRPEGEGFAVDSLLIEDYPDKEFRAFMLDLSRQWHPFDKVLKYVDLCFLYKIKYLHLHFIDDQLYTLPSAHFPKLPTPNKHYSFEQIKFLRRYTQERGIALIPEFECPGHAARLVRTYPEIFANRLDEQVEASRTEMGALISDKNVVCAGSEQAWEATKMLLSEICEMFPEAPYIHVGGDEANSKVWESCSICRAYMQKNGIEDERALYSDYVARITQYVCSLGRTPMVWEGFPEKNAEKIPRETVVVAWDCAFHRPDRLLAEGFRIINATWQPLYLVPSIRRRWSPSEILAWNVYNWQHWWAPSPATLNPITIPENDRMLGSLMCAWEMTFEQGVGRVMENLSAFTERTWNVSRVYTDDEFYAAQKKLMQIAPIVIQDR